MVSLHYLWWPLHMSHKSCASPHLVRLVGSYTLYHVCGHGHVSHKTNVPQWMNEVGRMLNGCSSVNFESSGWNFCTDEVGKLRLNPHRSCIGQRNVPNRLTTYVLFWLRASIMETDRPGDQSLDRSKFRCRVRAQCNLGGQSPVFS